MNEPPNKTKLLAIEVIRAEMRITDARLTDAIDHEMGLRKLHEDAVDRVRRLSALKDDLQERAESIYRISSEERQRASCPEDSIDGDALAIPRSSGDSSPNREQAAFEEWLESTRPSGDAESVQRQWENSGELRDLYSLPNSDLS